MRVSVSAVCISQFMQPLILRPIENVGRVHGRTVYGEREAPDCEKKGILYRATGPGAVAEAAADGGLLNLRLGSTYVYLVCVSAERTSCFISPRQVPTCPYFSSRHGVLRTALSPSKRERERCTIPIIKLRLFYFSQEYAGIA